MSRTDQLLITGVDQVDKTSILVEFSDHTHAVFTLNQLLSLAPTRTPADLRDD